MDPELQYLTLSHCWRETPMPIKILRCNPESYKKHVKSTQLSPLFPDTFKVVRHLGFRRLSRRLEGRFGADG